MRKFAVVLALFMMAVVSARADDIYNEIDFGRYLDNPDNIHELPYPFDWSGWEMFCYVNGKEPDFNEYNRFMEIYGGCCLEEDLIPLEMLLAEVENE